MTGELHEADRLLAVAIGWEFKDGLYENLIDGKTVKYVMHRRPHFPEEGDYSWTPWDQGERFTDSMDACEDNLHKLLDPRGLDVILRVKGMRTVAEIWKGPTHISTCTRPRMPEAYAVALTRALMRLGDIPVTHEPHRTSDGSVAHGCEMCDGEDWCSCSESGSYAYCTGCGGSWPKCAEEVR